MLSSRVSENVTQRVQATLYVAPSGNDSNPGTLEAPFKSIGKAQEVVRSINSGMSGDIWVFLREGLYPLSETLLFTPEDSGSNDYKVIYQAYQGEKAVISGGTGVTGWSEVPGRPGVYQASLNRKTKLRSLFVNGRRAELPSKQVQGQGGYGTFSVNGTESWAETAGTAIDGIKFEAAEVGVYEDPDDVELVQATSNFTQITITARAIISEGPFNTVLLQQPYGAIAYSMAWNCGIHPDKNFTIQNAYELLNRRGQFYFNKTTQTLYYYSRGEDMATATVVAPGVEGLLQITGNSTSDRVTNLEFVGLTFSYDDWLLKEVAGSRGFVGVQSTGLYTRYRADGRWHATQYDMVDLPQATIEVRNADSILFKANTFTHLGSGTAISLTNDVINSSVTGNIFQDLLGNAINVGHPQHYIIGDGPLYPAGVEGICYNDEIKNNLIRASSLAFAQEELISGYFTASLIIAHNDLQDAPYGGIANGWWWGDAQLPPPSVQKDNKISHNKVVNAGMVLPDDGGAIYVLGIQPGSEMSYNYLVNSARGLYTDDGSQGWYIHHNVVESPRSHWVFLWTPRIQNESIDNNFTSADNAHNNGTNTPVTNTHLELDAPPWSAEAQAIIDNAGLEKEWQHLLESQ
ncbi:MAG TPA: right-handed parallel beta-helix repeat-containing protein [Chloroflexia bacterium]|nr:right-handed parallel beta-helix repeat-containing protein [Chloroflexia bacterium]